MPLDSFAIRMQINKINDCVREQSGDGLFGSLQVNSPVAVRDGWRASFFRTSLSWRISLLSGFLLSLRIL